MWKDREGRRGRSEYSRNEVLNQIRTNPSSIMRVREKMCTCSTTQRWTVGCPRPQATGTRTLYYTGAGRSIRRSKPNTLSYLFDLGGVEGRAH